MGFDSLPVQTEKCKITLLDTLGAGKSSSVFYSMKKIRIKSLLGYSVSVVTFILGIGIFVRIFRFDNIPPQLRYSFALVLVLWAIYRALTTYFKDKQSERENEV